MFWKTFLMPLAHRVGTAVGTGLATYGVASSEIEIIVAGLVAAIGVGIDIALDKVGPR